MELMSDTVVTLPFSVPSWMILRAFFCKGESPVPIVPLYAMVASSRFYRCIYDESPYRAELPVEIKVAAETD